ncbi:MAG: mannose-1-phosphate guanylyltransferase/mannose-6-phosphate isomerase [Actinomycetota bacterium]|jgi:mannose-1-phosphate guanylyltransferase/mannose-6-phosphate isomerase|nr:mannose-1-phosphate guanylyltransferase/mannose-6-phosphate isomerase [Actinomycetota bacterium]
MIDQEEPIQDLHAIILAGGSGARFWPLSRELSPKQMLSIFGGVSLITQAVRRIRPLLKDSCLHVLTNEALRDELRNHLTAQEELVGLDMEFLAEPTPRNTAPAIALAAAYLVAQDPDALMIVLPSDHLLQDGDVWRDTIALASDLARDGRLVTVGLSPDRPETGYGYIHAGDAIDGFERGASRGHSVVEFVEKPDYATAERFLAQGCYLWNSGMLVARASVILDELVAAGAAAATPDSENGAQIARVARELAAAGPASWNTDAARNAFASLPAVPFDKAVLEVSARVAVVPAQLEWSDVGSLLALADLDAPDERGNVLVGNITDIDSHDVIAYSADRLVATLGLKDLIVVDTADATLIADRSRAQDVRGIVDALKASGNPEVVSSRESLRPWGSWTLHMKAPGFQIKSIVVRPGHRLSLQSHTQRSEHWVVVEGTAIVERDGVAMTVAANESAYIPIGCRHRLSNTSDESLRVIEVAVGDYLGEDDIVRYEDDWGREGN